MLHFFDRPLQAQPPQAVIGVQPNRLDTSCLIRPKTAVLCLLSSISGILATTSQETPALIAKFGILPILLIAASLKRNSDPWERPFTDGTGVTTIVLLMLLKYYDTIKNYHDMLTVGLLVTGTGMLAAAVVALLVRIIERYIVMRRIEALLNINIQIPPAPLVLLERPQPLAIDLAPIVPPVDIAIDPFDAAGIRPLEVPLLRAAQ